MQSYHKGHNHRMCATSRVTKVLDFLQERYSDLEPTLERNMEAVEETSPGPGGKVTWKRNMPPAHSYSSSVAGKKRHRGSTK